MLTWTKLQCLHKMKICEFGRRECMVQRTGQFCARGKHFAWIVAARRHDIN